LKRRSKKQADLYAHYATRKTSSNMEEFPAGASREEKRKGKFSASVGGIGYVEGRHKQLFRPHGGGVVVGVGG